MQVGDKVVRKKGYLFTKDAPGTIVKQHRGNSDLYDIEFDDERAGTARFVHRNELRLANGKEDK